MLLGKHHGPIKANLSKPLLCFPSKNKVELMKGANLQVNAQLWVSISSPDCWPAALPACREMALARALLPNFMQEEAWSGLWGILILLPAWGSWVLYY